MEIAEIKQRLTLAEVVRHYGYKADKQNRICCPFHDDSTPSMQLYWKTHTCYCFSSNCKTHGKSMDVIDFIMHKESCTKHEALVKATAMISGTASPAAELTRTAILSKMFTYFKNAVYNSKPAQDYIQSRALDYTKLEIGYNSGQFHHGTRRDDHLIKSCLQVGLLSPFGTNSRSGGQAYKPFAKYCIVFALCNKTGQVSGLYFRSTVNDEASRHFYLKDREGLYPKYPEANTKKLILTESIIDAATLQQQEDITKHYTVLALYGTNGLTEEHTVAVSQLKNLDEIIFFLNGDDAGRAAVKKHSVELHKLLPQVTISNIEPSQGEDVNSIAQGHTADIFTELLQGRVRLDVGEDKLPEQHAAEQHSGIAQMPERHAVEQHALLFSNEKKDQRPAQVIPVPEETPPAKGINTSNPECITYQTAQLHITLLGGISLTGLDRLRVTIKMSLNPPLTYHHSIRSNVDLYQDDAVEKFIRRAAEKIEIGTSVISATLARLTEQLEQYRLEQLEKKKVQQPKIKALTAEEIQKAKEYLCKKDLMQRTMDDLGKTGIVGEENNRLLMYLIFTSRKRENPLHIVSLGSSGIGKTWLQEKVSQCIPEEDKKEITALSENAFYYFGREELKGKLILIEDLDGAGEVLYPLRELQSKQKITKTVPLKDSKGNLKTVTMQVEGPVSVSGCTTRERIYEDNANRSFLIYIDESREQDSRIMAYQKNLSAGTINKAAEQQMKEQFSNMQRVLKSVTVRNPYAPFLQIPESIFKPRRTNAHYIAFIEAVTFYHQYQRELKTDQGTGEKYIETTLEDIAWTNKLLNEILLRKSDELSGACRNFFESLKDHLQQNNQTSFYAKDIRTALRINPSNLKRYLIELHRNNHLKLSGGSKRMGFEYQVSDYQEYNTLKTGITTVLDEIYNKLQSKENGKKNGSMVQNGSAALMNHSAVAVSMS